MNRTDIPAYPAFDCEVITNPRTDKGLHITGKTGVKAQTVIDGRAVESMVLVDNAMLRANPAMSPVDFAAPVIEDEWARYLERRR